MNENEKKTRKKKERESWWPVWYDGDCINEHLCG